MIKIRPMEKTDRDYITRSVLMSFMSGSREIQKINKDAYLKSHNETLNSILDSVSTIVICDDQEDGLVYGFIIFETAPLADILHYLYIRRDFRGKGLATKLLEIAKTKNTLCVMSHLTDDFKPARLKKYWSKVLYDPYTRLKPRN